MNFVVNLVTIDFLCIFAGTLSADRRSSADRRIV